MKQTGNVRGLKISTSFRILLVLTLSLGMSQALSHAQLTTADVVGALSDGSGAANPGAGITLTNLATHVARTATSNEAGDYTFTLVDPGSYKIEITEFTSGLAPINVVTASGLENGGLAVPILDIDHKFQTIWLQSANLPICVEVPILS